MIDYNIPYTFDITDYKDTILEHKIEPGLSCKTTAFLTLFINPIDSFLLNLNTLRADPSQKCWLFHCLNLLNNNIRSYIFIHYTPRDLLEKYFGDPMNKCYNLLNTNEDIQYDEIEKTMKLLRKRIIKLENLMTEDK